MENSLRQINAAIAFVGIPKKRLARFCKISPSLFSQYLHGDLIMPEAVEDRLTARLRDELSVVLSETPTAELQSAGANDR